MRKIYTTSIFRNLLALLFVIALFNGSSIAQWQVYDGTVLPDANTPPFGTSGLAGAGVVSTLVTDLENRYLELKTAVEADNGTWRYVYPEPVTAITIVMRVKAADMTGARVIELDADNGGFRERLYLNRVDNKLRLQHSTGFGSTNEFSLPGEASVSDWHIYRLTKDAAGNVKLYFDENTVPLATGQTTVTTTNNHFRFGDTNGSHNISALLDWIIWDQSGAYAPGEGTALPAGLVLDNKAVVSPAVSGFKVYPNPANSIITIEKATAEDYPSIEIISLTGQLILRKQALSAVESIDISHLSKGSYIINLNTGQNKSSRLFLKN
jgi:hypothetical protein